MKLCISLRDLYDEDIYEGTETKDRFFKSLTNEDLISSIVSISGAWQTKAMMLKNSIGVSM